MGFFSGSIGYRTYRVVGDFPDNFKDTLQTFANRYLFQPFKDEVEEETKGFVPVKDILGEKIGYDDMFFNNYVVLGLRKDTRKVPANALKAYTQKAVEQFRVENNLESVPKHRRKEIRETTNLKLLRRIFPKITIAEAVWNINEGTLFLFSIQERINEDFLNLFKRSFTVELLPQNAPILLRSMGKELANAKIDQTTLAEEFLTWLFFRIYTDYFQITAAMDEGTECWVNDLIALKNERSSTSLRGLVADSCLETKISLIKGNLINKLRLGIKRNDLEWSFTLTKPPLEKTAVTIPAILGIEDDDSFYERIGHIEEVERTINTLFTLFLDKRTDERKWSIEQDEMKTWLSEIDLATLQE